VDVRRGADIDNPFGYFRHVLVRRVWELILECEDHRHQFVHLIPSRSSEPYKQMAKDPGGRRRMEIEEEFLELYPDELDCEDGCSTALYYVIQDLRAHKEQLVTDNTGLAYHRALREAWRGRLVGLEMEDLVQHGLIGLQEAIERFEQERGFTFGTYSPWWIKHHIRRAIDNGSLVRVPVHRQYRKAGRTYAPVISLDAKLGDGDERSYIEMLEDAGRESAQEQLITHYRVQELLKQVETLRPRDRDMLKMRFGLRPWSEPHTLQEVGERFNLTRERVRQVCMQSMFRLRMRMAS